MDTQRQIGDIVRIRKDLASFNDSHKFRMLHNKKETNTVNHYMRQYAGKTLIVIDNHNQYRLGIMKSNYDGEFRCVEPEDHFKDASLYGQREIENCREIEYYWTDEMFDR